MGCLKVSLITCLAITASCLPQDTSVADHDFVLPEAMTYTPLTYDIPTWPAVCNGSQPSDECVHTLEDWRGAHIFYASDHGCSREQQDKIKLGFEGAQNMLRYAAPWPRDGTSRDIVSAEYWMGADWANQEDRIKGNLQRASSFINNEEWKGYYIYLSCNDPKHYCGTVDYDHGKEVGGYAWNQFHVAWWTSLHINMCGGYYTVTDFAGKMADLNWWRQRGDIGQIQLMDNYKTYGQYMLHEMMHLYSTWKGDSEIIDQKLPGVPGYLAYASSRVYKLAHGRPGTTDVGYGASSSSLNADSYAMLVNSIFWWDVTGLFPEANGKQKRSSATMPLIYLNSSQASIDDPVQIRQIIDSYFVEDPDDTDESPHPVALVDKNVCHGVNGDYWVRSRDTAIENANDFCNQGDQTKRYNIGSVNELEFSAKKLGSKDKGPKDDPNCFARLRDGVIDGCDSDDRINNPHNYKFGSVLITADSWQYAMKPLSKQVVDVNCDVSYKFFFDSFEIRGKNLPDAMLGPSGEGLQHQLSGCGALTSWQFEFTPDDCCFQWYASGRLPIGTKNCIGDALMAAGGNHNGNCHGPGKRSILGKRDSISSWPGYGDDGKHVFGKHHNITAPSHLNFTTHPYLNSTNLPRLNFTTSPHFNISISAHNISVPSSSRRYNESHL